MSFQVLSLIDGQILIHIYFVDSVENYNAIMFWLPINCSLSFDILQSGEISYKTLKLGL